MRASDGGGDGVARPMNEISAPGNGAGGAPWPQAGADGGPMAVPIEEPADALPFSAAYVPCLRGPCRHYFHAETHFDHGNPKGTFAEGKEPRQQMRICKAISGVFLEMSADSPVYDCTDWDPLLRSEELVLNARRDEYLEANPEHQQHRRPPIGDDLDELDDEEEEVDEKEPEPGHVEPVATAADDAPTTDAIPVGEYVVPPATTQPVMYANPETCKHVPDVSEVPPDLAKDFLISMATGSGVFLNCTKCKTHFSFPVKGA